MVEKSDVAKREEEILKYWQDNKIFEQTLEKTKNGPEFIFYDGPPFATGTPHYGHILAGTIKDAIPRYQTMKGRFVRRRWGWDCHGLPVENLIEKKLNLKTKKDIEDYGVGRFNAEARLSVMEYVDEWKRQVPRLGRFVDMEDDYRTMDPAYSETIWWIFRSLYERGYIYEGYKAMQICPRCETTLSNFEVNQGYRDITDISITAKFELIDEPGTFILAWTTTPWTLPGNVALAVNPDVTYVKITDGLAKYILALPRLEAVAKGDYRVLEEFPGRDLLGRSYRPVFDYYTDSELKNAKGEKLAESTGWKIYPASFVTTEDGTGVVHIAPAFGEDDMSLGLENNLPFIQHVAMNGTFKSEVGDWAGRQVKPKDNHQETDIEVLKSLAARDLVYHKEKFTHSYPHCWRCQTPLLNYATSSWFVRVTDFRDRLVEENKNISWVPEHIRDGRFGRWLEGARDWAISRSRFWGAPLPVWKCSGCQKIFVAGSVADLVDRASSANNQYWVMRHGEGEHNLKSICSSDPNRPHHLTDKGKIEVRNAAVRLRSEGITLVVHSNYVRARETAEIVAEELDLAPEQLIAESRLGEINFGDYDGRPVADYHAFFENNLEKFKKSLPNGESMKDVRKRVLAVFQELEEKYQNEKILIVGHDSTVWMLEAGTKGLNPKEAAALHEEREDYVSTGSFVKLDYHSFPHNDEFELDLHRPFIDEVKWSCSCGGEFVRVPEVFDCWFESGSMPYGQMHHPFAGKEIFDPEKNIGFPADFIAEGLDQTRGWFYSMLVIAVALFDRASFKNVIVNGIVLAENGEKMSKSLKNYPDPMVVVDKYGADALRLYLLSSPIVRAEDLNFSEKGLAELYRKIIARLMNVFSFYGLYADGHSLVAVESDHILDRWIKARLEETANMVSEAMERYELDRAVRPLDDFIDDLSNWYIRRSRERFKEEGDDRLAAIATTRTVLLGLSKLLAPFAPFTADYLYLRLRGSEDELSVHLASWPNCEKVEAADQRLIENMSEARRVVSLGLEARAKMSIKVRQPLASITVKSILTPEYIEIIKDELNVKAVHVDQTMADDVVLDTELTPSLIAEGNVREFIRFIQDYRKQLGLVPGDRITLAVRTSEEGQRLLADFEPVILSAVGADSLNFDSTGGPLEIALGDWSFAISVKRL